MNMEDWAKMKVGISIKSVRTKILMNASTLSR